MIQDHKKPFERAIVIGGSIAGLLAARALSERFRRVTIFERDTLEDDATPRKGAPQGRHTHALLNAGAEIMEEFFPGLFDELGTHGVKRTDMAADWVWFHFGVWKSRSPSNVHMYCVSRPFLEWNIRKRLRELDNVEIHDNMRVAGYLLEGDRIAGVEVSPPGQEPGVERADLIVDASGRGTRTPQWLQELGYGTPEEERVEVKLGYASRLVKLPEDAARDWEVMIIYPKPPESKRIGYLFPIEGGRHIMNVAAYCGDYPPADEEGFIAFAKSLRPEYYEALKDAEPLTPIATHRFPDNLRRHYETMPRFPDRIVVLGDALCSFDPLFGQGMTTASLGARALRDCVRERAGDLDGIARQFFTRTLPFNNLAWLLSTSEDMRFPQLAGKRPFGMKFLNWFKSQIFIISSTDGSVYRKFLEVLNFKKGLTNLMSPGIMAKVLGKPFRRKAVLDMPRRVANAGDD